MNLALIAEYGPSIREGAILTVVLSTAVLAISVPLAFLVALGRYLRLRIVGAALSAYVHTFRALPALVVLYFVFYGTPRLGFAPQPFTAALIGLCLTCTAYMSEDFRGALNTVPRGQWEAAQCLGLGRFHTVWRIIVPQIVPVAVPPVLTSTIITIKTTAIASLVGVKELTGASMAAVSLTYTAIEFLLVAAALYLALSAVLVAVQALIEGWLARRFRLPKERLAAPTVQAEA